MTLKIISLNIWDGGKLFENLKSFLLTENADILMLQEVYHSDNHELPQEYWSYDLLKSILNYPYTLFAPAFLEDVDGKEVISGNVIFSKYPLNEVSVRFFDVPFSKRRVGRPYFHLTPRNLQHVVAQVDETQLHILNTQGIWGEEGGDSPRRIEMAKMIVNEIAELSPVVLAGDFNVQPHTKTIELIESKLQNVFKNELITSFNVKQKDLEKYPGYATAVVDMVFTSPDIQLLKHHCPQVNVSDHLPMIIEITV